MAFLKPYRLAALLAPLMMGVEIAMDLSQPALVSRLVNRGVLAGEPKTILRIALVMTAAALIGFVAGVLCNVFAIRVSQNMGADVRAALFRRVMWLSRDGIHQFSVGSLATRLTDDVTQVQTLVQQLQQGLVRGPGLAIGSMIMAVWLDHLVGVVLVGSAVLLAVVLAFTMRLAYSRFLAAQQALDLVNSEMQEHLVAMRVVRAFAREEEALRRFSAANDAYTRASIRAMRVMVTNTPVLNLLLDSAIVAILWFGGHRVWHHRLTVGGLVAGINYATQALSSLLWVSSMLVSASQAMASAVRIEEVLQKEPSIREPAVAKDASPHPHIRLSGVTMAYPGAFHPTLKEVSLDIRAGESLGIIGPTGSGKTSLIQLLPRLYDPQEGVITWNGVDLRELRLGSLRGRVAIVPQRPTLFSGTIRENIAFGRPQLTDDELVACTNMAQALEFIERLPDGFETRVAQRGVSLSGGQRQRIAIARALAIRPRVLILDDATSALDAATEAALFAALRAVDWDLTVVMVSSRVATVRRCDRIAVMDAGKLEAIGTHEELWVSSALYREIWASQAGMGHKEATLR